MKKKGVEIEYSTKNVYKVYQFTYEMLMRMEYREFIY